MYDFINKGKVSKKQQKCSLYNVLSLIQASANIEQGSCFGAIFSSKSKFLKGKPYELMSGRLYFTTQRQLIIIRCQSCGT